MWLALLAKYDIMDPALSARRQSAEVWSTEAANRVRLVLKHLLDLKASGTAFVPLDLQELLDAVGTAAPLDAVGAAAPLDAVGPAAPASKPTPPPRALVQHDSVASNVSSAPSVVMCGFSCQCESCRKPVCVSSCEAEGDRSAQNDDASHEVIPRVLSSAPVAKRPAAAKASPAKKARRGSHVKIVFRHSPIKDASAYILLDGKYCCGISKKQHDRYIQVIQTVAAELEDGTIASKASAIERCKQLTRS